MELKDVILSTLAEIEEIATIPEAVEIPPISKMEESFYRSSLPEDVKEPIINVRDDESRMLEGIRERLLVLFEGFQSPNNVQIEAKVDLTLNFFEYLLATIDNRLETIKK
ncbi:hypothetical protein [Sulfuricurvum sp.]|uniref:CiaD-like domain-containing protein n=1 Tax=Sulfuricurvum sp. TaxID=2025608 RepID=UPI0035658ABB